MYYRWQTEASPISAGGERKGPFPLALSSMDLAVGRRMQSSCWFVTSIGIAIIQMQLLAQAWQQTHLAVWTAGIASCWILGSVLFTRLDPRILRAARLWGISFVICAFLEVRFLPASHLFFFPLSLSTQTLIRRGELAVVAFLLGMMSTAWLVQRGAFLVVGERTRLSKGLLSTMVGLSMAWLFPAIAGPVGLACVFPLLILDFWLQAGSPLPASGKIVDTSYNNASLGADLRPLQFHRRRFPSGWWWSYLAKRGRLSIILLASLVSVILGGVWSAVPTPFASSLSRLPNSHAIDLLGWLVLSQLLALALGAWCLGAARAILGAVDRIIPQKWQVSVWCTAMAALFLMATSLLLVGLAPIQAPLGSWILVASVAIYTLAGATWGVLLPRLKPSLGTVLFAQRHLTFTQVRTGQLAYERAQEEYASRLLLTMEGILTALVAPILGWLVDRWSVDSVFMGTGIFLLAFLGLSVTVVGRRRKKQPSTAVTLPLSEGQEGGERGA